uniref:Uncharacterized protein n=1 Tax=Arundo donax TaxID=35708 RepID=A0A0A9SJ84_ARUDO
MANSRYFQKQHLYPTYISKQKPTRKSLIIGITS